MGLRARVTWDEYRELKETGCTRTVSISMGLMSIDGQVRLVRLQTDNFRLFLRKQTDK